MDLLKTLLEFVIGIISKKEVAVQVSLPLGEPQEPVKNQEPVEVAINWSDPSCHVTEHFTVRDCLLLHSWNRLGTEVDGADFDKLVILCRKMEEIRSLLGCSINVHCTYRSSKYNIEQKILLPTGMDVHAMNLAVDFDCNQTMTIQEVKDKLEPKLEELGIRMEKGTTTWVHIDLHHVGPSGRYFTA